MKKLFLAIFAAIAVLSMAAGGALAARPPAGSEQAGPYQGVFSGYVYGDRGSRAPITLEMTHLGSSVSGEMTLGEGLYLNGGVCGSGYIPASVQSASGETVSTDRNQLQAEAEFRVSGLQISAELDSQISPDGEGLTAQVKIDLPWLCGRDPVLNAELSKAP